MNPTVVLKLSADAVEALRPLAQEHGVEVGVDEDGWGWARADSGAMVAWVTEILGEPMVVHTNTWNEAAERIAREAYGAGIAVGPLVMLMGPHVEHEGGRIVVWGEELPLAAVQRVVRRNGGMPMGEA
jgi:hypothetical protein